jgi:predicted HTH domain antitoxin
MIKAMSAIEIPTDILRAARMTEADLRLELAIALFQQNRLSFGKARELAGLDIWTFQQVLASRGIPPHYDIPDYEADLESLDRS